MITKLYVAVVTNSEFKPLGHAEWATYIEKVVYTFTEASEVRSTTFSAPTEARPVVVIIGSIRSDRLDEVLGYLRDANQYHQADDIELAFVDHYTA